ncbi:MAG: ABC transporter ATP-binding protein [Nitrososphaeria archaeon]
MKLKVENITKTYGKVVALKDVNLEVGEGEYVVIVGPSGCGKSTLLKVIMGIIEQDEGGKILVDGKDVSNLPPEDRNLGFVFQNILLFPHLTAFENIAYSPIVKDFNLQLRDKLIEELFLFGKVDPWRDKYPEQISSRGIQQKVALMRALATGSKLLLLDEPLCSLDSRVRISLRQEVKKIVKQLQITAIHVTHDQEEAMSIADKIVIMRKGSIVEIGSPEELYYYPKNIFTAYFLGKGNFVPGKIVRRKYKQSAVKCGELVFESASRFELGSDVVVFFRPESVVFERKGYNDYVGKVIEKRFLGRQIEFIIKVGATTFTSRSLRIDAPSLNVGDTVDFHVDEERILVFKFPEEGLESAFKLE